MEIKQKHILYFVLILSGLMIPINIYAYFYESTSLKGTILNLSVNVLLIIAMIGSIIGLKKKEN